MKVGDKLRHRKDKDLIATVHHSTFGFSLHWMGGDGILKKTLGTTEEGILLFWELIKDETEEAGM